MAVPRRRMTLEEFLALPEQKPPLEFMDGVVTQTFALQGQRSRLRYCICEQFNSAGHPGRLAMGFMGLRTTYGGASFIQDVAVYRWNRIPVDAAAQIADDFLEPPDITVEIVPPEQHLPALVPKCLAYVDRGVAMAVLVQPGDRSVRLFRPGTTPAVLRGPDLMDFGEVVPGLQFTVQELFSSLDMR